MFEVKNPWVESVLSVGYFYHKESQRKQQRLAKKFVYFLPHSQIEKKSEIEFDKFPQMNCYFVVNNKLKLKDCKTSVRVFFVESNETKNVSRTVFAAIFLVLDTPETSGSEKAIRIF